MIPLTRLNNHPLVVNSDLIKFVEQAPDTVITLLNGEKIVVRETAQDVLERVVRFRRAYNWAYDYLYRMTGETFSGSGYPAGEK